MDHKGPSGIGSPAQYPLTAKLIDARMREQMEDSLFRLRSLGLEALAAGVGSRSAAVYKLNMTVHADYRGMLQESARDVSAYLKWRQHMEIYDVHPALTNSLLRLGSKSKIPGGIFRRLRHPNPYLSLTAGVPVMHADGQPGRVFGFYVTGAQSPKYPMHPGSKNLRPAGAGLSAVRTATVLDTYDTDANALYVVITSEVLDQAEETVLDLDMCSLIIPMTVDFALENLVDEVAGSGFAWGQGMQGSKEHRKERPYLMTMARVAISHLLYACSRTVEIADPPAGAGKRKKGEVKESKKRSKIHPVGYRIGAAIESSVRPERSAAGERGSRTAGFKMPPHIRAPHPHLYWVGEGRQEAEIKFLDPIPVNIQDEADMITRHSMQ